MSLVIFTISPAYVVCQKFGGHRGNESKRSRRRCLDGFVSYNFPYWLWHVVWSMSQVFFPPLDTADINQFEPSNWVRRKQCALPCHAKWMNDEILCASHLENNIIVNECVASLFSCSFAHAVVDNLYLCLEHSPRLWLRRNFPLEKGLESLLSSCGGLRVWVCVLCMYDGTGEGAHEIRVSITPLWKAVRTSSSQ